MRVLASLNMRSLSSWPLCAWGKILQVAHQFHSLVPPALFKGRLYHLINIIR